MRLILRRFVRELRDTADLNKRKDQLREILKEGERARDEESRLRVWEP
ncbi:MAG: hypothetical protein ACYC3X_06135 [Pirellulaceae bacterium]